ncbi:MAG: hypothetical protein ACP5NV_02320 [Candidatus Woesearchaeota archaeon]
MKCGDSLDDVVKNINIYSQTLLTRENSSLSDDYTVVCLELK